MRQSVTDSSRSPARGKALKDGRTWAAGKQDVTIEALVAVAEHAILFGDKTGEAVEIRNHKGELEYTITVSKERGR